VRRSTDGTPPRVDSPTQPHHDPDAHGPLVLIGGACTPDGEALQSFIDLARAAGGPIVGITSASENPMQSARLWRADFRKAGPVVWLQVDVRTLQARIDADATTAARRPNLTAVGGPAEIAQLLAVREPLYRETATLILDAARSVEEIVDEILANVLPAGRA